MRKFKFNIIWLWCFTLLSVFNHYRAHSQCNTWSPVFALIDDKSKSQNIDFRVAASKSGIYVILAPGSIIWVFNDAGRKISTRSGKIQSIAVSDSGHIVIAENFSIKISRDLGKTWNDISNEPTPFERNQIYPHEIYYVTRNNGKKVEGEIIVKSVKNYGFEASVTLWSTRDGNNWSSETNPGFPSFRSAKHWISTRLGKKLYLSDNGNDVFDCEDSKSQLTSLFTSEEYIKSLEFIGNKSLLIATKNRLYFKNDFSKKSSEWIDLSESFPKTSEISDLATTDSLIIMTSAGVVYVSTKEKLISGSNSHKWSELKETINGGMDWSGGQIETQKSFENITAFYKSGNIIAISEWTSIDIAVLISTDNGQRWKTSTIKGKKRKNQEKFYVIFEKVIDIYISGKQIFVLTDEEGHSEGDYVPSGRLYKSVDFGASWETVQEKIRYPRNLYYVDDQLFIVGGKDIYVSNDEGITLKSYSLGLSELSWVRGSSVFDSSIWIATNKSIMKSAFRNIQFNVISSKFTGEVNIADFYPGEKMFSAITSNGLVFHSTDKGKTWKKLSSICELRPASTYRIIECDSTLFVLGVSIVRYDNENKSWVTISSSLPFKIWSGWKAFDNEPYVFGEGGLWRLKLNN
ncbi:MAG TPA: hypothetical protein PLG25_01760 [bacterium]|nr:hypothetical protein [bacterium]HND78250.1 hypothetical protein [bacterium]HNE82567.1 hypothetical protein [bacterium]HNH31908.1 hypothetical protein [bacterium]HNI09650.1 hypothetical protein [bacterium]